MISKRADDDIDDWYKKEVAEEDRQNGVHDSDWYRQQVATAERMNEEHLRKHAPTWRSFNEVLAENMRKSYAADARGDEADRHDEETPADELVDGDGDSVADSGNNHHASQVADLLVESGKHTDRQAALDHLLHTAHGAAMLRRLHKSEDTPIDAFESHLAGVGEDGRAVALDVLVEAQAKANFGQHTSKRGLADLKRITPQVVAVQLDEVEGVEEGTVVVAVVANEIERRHALSSQATASPSMMQERERKRAQRLDDQREAAGEVNQYPARLYFWLLLFNGRCFVYEIFAREWLK